MKKIKIKKITAMSVAAVVSLTATACGKSSTWGAVIDGEQIPAGIFIYYLQSAYYDAQSKLSEDTDSTEETTETDLYTAQIDGKNGKDWIYDEATHEMQIYAAVENKFDEYGLSISDEDLESAQAYCDQVWDWGSEYYTNMGISQQSFESIYLNNNKRSTLFEYLYSEGGEQGVPDSEVKAYLDENYALINYIDIELKDGEGNLLKSDGKSERMKMAEDYVARYKNGEDFDELNAEYVTWYQKLQDDAAAAAAEEADATESDSDDTNQNEDGSALSGGISLVPEQDAQAGAPDEDDTSEDETGEDETTEETSAASDEDADAVADTDEEQSDDTAGSADIMDMSVSDISSVSTVSSNEQVIEKDGGEPEDTVCQKVFDEMQSGDIEIIETADGEHYYIVLREDILEDESYFEAAKYSLLFEMKEEDYDALIETWVDAQSISRNQAAYDRYDPKKMFAV